jgi:signal transduction histidine kinase
MERRSRGIADTYEVRLIRRDESRIYVTATASPVTGKDGEYAGGLVLMTDISERREMEQRLKQAEHLAGIGETAAMVGHDLRNPLQGIAGAIYLLRDESLPPEGRGEMLKLIEDCVEYSDGIVKDLLDYARPFEPARVETTPREIAANALRALQVPSRIKVVDLSQEQPRISVDPERMKRAFVNLVENAVDAMPKGGTLTVSSKESNGLVELAVSDTGIGMSKEASENLWKPLQTTKAKGMGMGLAIVKRIVDAHNGTISVESRTGEGTIFTIRLPIKPEPLNHL